MYFFSKDTEYTERVKTILLGLGIDAENHRSQSYAYFFAEHVSEAQLVVLAKLARFGWRARKFYYKTDSLKGNVMALGLSANDCTAFLYPDGSLDRAANGKKTVYLADDWKERV